MTNLNLRKMKVKNSLIACLIFLAVLIALFPLAIYFFIDFLRDVQNGKLYSRAGGLLLICIILFVWVTIYSVYWLLIYMKLRKINYPTEEVHEAYCTKISLRRAGGMTYMRIKTHRQKFLYILTKDIVENIRQLREKYQKQTLFLHCYAGTKLVKEIKLQK